MIKLPDCAPLMQLESSRIEPNGCTEWQFTHHVLPIVYVCRKSPDGEVAVAGWIAHDFPMVLFLSYEQLRDCLNTKH